MRRGGYEVKRHWNDAEGKGEERRQDKETEGKSRVNRRDE